MSIAATIPPGCATLFPGSKPEFQTEPEPWAGPEIETTTNGEYNAVTVRAPTPGWVVTLDGDRPRLDYHEAFVTLREPNPAFVYPQVIAEHRLLTAIPADRDIRVYARRVGFNEDGGGYHPVQTPQR